jgi:hypothetical protein
MTWLSQQLTHALRWSEGDLCGALPHKYWVDSNDSSSLSVWIHLCLQLRANSVLIDQEAWVDMHLREQLKVWLFDVRFISDFSFWCLVSSDVSCLKALTSNLTWWSSKELLKHHHLSLHSVHVWHHSQQTDAVYYTYVVLLRLHCLSLSALSARTDYHSVFESTCSRMTYTFVMICFWEWDITVAESVMSIRRNLFVWMLMISEQLLLLWCVQRLILQIFTKLAEKLDPDTCRGLFIECIQWTTLIHWIFFRQWLWSVCQK